MAACARVSKACLGRLRVAKCPAVIPHDVVDADWNGDVASLAIDETYRRVPAHRARSLAEKIAAAAPQTGRAWRSRIVGGAGVHWPKAYDELARLAGKADALTATSLTGKGVFEGISERSIGVLNLMGSKAALALASVSTFKAAKRSLSTCP